jgi:hypothetical protein
MIWDKIIDKTYNEYYGIGVGLIIIFLFLSWLLVSIIKDVKEDKENEWK